MFKTRRAPDTRRRGVILMVVLAMLTLFAIVGLTFLLYASSAADNARISREGETQDRPDLDPELAFKLFLGQFIYDAPDDETGVYSSLRGHSLARTMYGFFDGSNPGAASVIPLNDKAFNGTGPLRYDSPFKGMTTTLAADNRYMVNFTFFPADLFKDPSDGKMKHFLRDPERLQWRQSPDAVTPIDPNNRSLRGIFTGGFNPSYTYPDHANMFLAVIDPRTGQVVMPSFHRPWLFGGPMNATNPNWTTNPEGKYLTLRPRTVDMGPGFPEPEDGVYDVKNLDWAPGGNDSIWIDIGAPVITLPDGRRVKMLVAPLIIDLDGRVNLNAHGNVNGKGNYTGTAPGGDHAGNQGWGMWEVNLQKVLNKDAAASEWKNLFLGTSAVSGNDQDPGINPKPPTTAPALAYISGRYGQVRWPMPLRSVTPGPGTLHPYAPADWDGILNDPSGGGGATYQQPTTLYELPNVLGVNTKPWQPFPYFSPYCYLDGLNGAAYPTVPRNHKDETRLHPQWYNPLRPALGNRLLPLPGMVALLRGAGLASGGTNSEAMTSDLLRLCPTNFADVSTRNLVTTLSMDLDRPGALPYVWDRDPATVPSYYGILMPGGVVQPYPAGKAPIAFDLSNRAKTPVQAGEFDPNTWRSLTAALRLDLSRKLTPYPAPDPAKGFNDLPPGGTGVLAAQFNQAQLERTNLAGEIFERLRKVTGAPDVPLPVNPASDAYLTNRWLAQLAVNIVDYIDEDDYSTPFRWLTDTTTTPTPTPYYVYGTELPRVVLNELYMQWNKVGTNSFVNVWAELLNPLYSPAIAGSPTGWPYHGDAGDAILEFGNAASHYSAYQILLADPTVTAGVNDFGTPVGPGAGPIKNTATPWKNTTFPSGLWKLKPVDQSYQSSPSGAKNAGFYVVGPLTSGTGATVPTGEDPLSVAAVSPTANAAEMSYLANGPASPKTVVYLQRLLCPYLPLQTNPNPPAGSTPYNPFVTVDVIDTSDPTLFPGNKALMDARLGVAGLSWANRTSFGRSQPYAGHPAQLRQQNPPARPATQPFHTFFGHNFTDYNQTTPTPPSPTTAGQTLAMPFDWLIHMDRQLVSPAELLYVSGYRPWELTNKFVQRVPVGPMIVNEAQLHRAPWLDETARIYRLLEFVETRCTASGVSVGGRIPGKININTIWDDGRIFRALCDAELGNAFRDTRTGTTNPDTFVDQVYQRLMKQRTPGWPTPGQSDVATGSTDRPFWSLATGPSIVGGDNLSARNRGIDDTLLRRDTSTPANYDRTLDPYPKDGITYPGGVVPPAPPTPVPPIPSWRSPYQRFEMLNKLFNNLTTRSNVFAVWVTVGFFEVAKDPTTGAYVGENFRPVKLGAEVGKAEGRNVRHRMFAIVDRTNLTAFQTATNAAITVPTSPYAPNPPIPTSLPISLAATSGFHANGRPWQVQDGSVLVYDPDTDNEETVVVQNVAGTLKATFTRSHAANAVVISRGNPGPWPRYEPLQDTGVVPYFAVID